MFLETIRKKKNLSLLIHNILNISIQEAIFNIL